MLLSSHARYMNYRTKCLQQLHLGPTNFLFKLHLQKHNFFFHPSLNVFSSTMALTRIFSRVSQKIQKLIESIFIIYKNSASRLNNVCTSAYQIKSEKLNGTFDFLALPSFLLHLCHVCSTLCSVYLLPYQQTSHI